MGTGPEFNSHEDYHRGLKVAALVKALDAAGADLDYVRTMGPVEWATASHAAGVKHPGEKTKAIVLAAFESRVTRAKTYGRPLTHSLPANPLDGLPQ